MSIGIPEMEALVGCTIDRILADKGYRGHNAPSDDKFRAFLSGQKRLVRHRSRELRRRSAIAPVIGHLTAERRMGRYCLWFWCGDADNAILAAVGYNSAAPSAGSGLCCVKSRLLFAPDLGSIPA